MFHSPLLTVVDNLLVMGLLDDNDLNHLLTLIDPTKFDATYDRGRRKTVGETLVMYRQHVTE